MRIQRYVAKDMRSALAQVREALGPDAVHDRRHDVANRSAADVGQPQALVLLAVAHQQVRGVVERAAVDSLVVVPGEQVGLAHDTHEDAVLVGVEPCARPEGHAAETHLDVGFALILLQSPRPNRPA